MKNRYKVIKIATFFLAGVLTLVPFFINAQSFAKAENKEGILAELRTSGARLKISIIFSCLLSTAKSNGVFPEQFC